MLPGSGTRLAVAVRVALGTPLAVGVITLSACSAGGRQPDTGGVAPQEYFRLFSAEWTEDSSVSQDPRILLRRSEQSGRGGLLEGADDFTDANAGDPGFGDSRAREAAADRAAREAVARLAADRPRRIRLDVDDAEVTVWLPGMPEVTVPVAGDAHTISRLEAPVELRVYWDGPRLVVEQRVRGGGAVVDRFEPLAGGDRMMVIRSLEGPAFRGSGEVRFAYDRRDL